MLITHCYRLEAEPTSVGKSDCGAHGGPGGGFREGNTCWKLTGRHKERLAALTRQREELERQQREKKAQEERDVKRAQAKKDSQFKRTRLYKDISDTLGTTEMDVIKDFRGLMGDIHKEMTRQADEYNDAFDELVDQFVGTDAAGRQKRGAFVTAVQRAGDPTRIQGFDEVVQYVRDHPHIAQALHQSLGESTGAADTEAMVFQALRNGKRPLPAFNSDEVWDSAMEYLGSIDTVEEAEAFDAQSEEDEAIPFGLDGSPSVFAMAVAHAPPGGIEIAGKQFRGGQFIPSEVAAEASPEEKQAIGLTEYDVPGGTSLKQKDVAAAGGKLQDKLKGLDSGENFDMSQQQYLGQVKDYVPAGSLSPKTAMAHVFWNPSLSHAAITEGRTVQLGRGAFEHMGSAGSLGATFVHEVEHLHDEHSGSGRNEFTPRLRQMVREIDSAQDAMQFLGKHGAENAQDYVESWFASHPGHDLSDDEKGEAAQRLIEKALALYGISADDCTGCAKGCGKLSHDCKKVR